MKRRSLLILSAVAIMFASCGTKGGESSGLMVPEDASMVIHINTPSLSSKLSWDEIKQTTWFKEILADKNEEDPDDSLAKEYLKDPASTGIDTKSDILFYMKKHGEGSYIIVAGSVADDDAFEKFLTAQSKSKGLKVKESKGFNYLESKDGAMVWNKSHFAFCDNGEMPNPAMLMKRGDRNSDSEYREAFPADSLRIFAIAALTLKDGDNLDKDPRFASLIKDGKDMHVWLNMANFYSGMNKAVPMMESNAIFKDNLMAASLNFENGKIVASAKQYYSESMTKLLSKYKSKPITADVINRIPADNVIGLIAFNFSPEGIKELFRMTNMDAMGDMFLGQLGLNTDDLIKATNGEVLISFSDPTQVQKPITVTQNGKEVTLGNRTKTEMKVLFATSINDKAAFEKLATAVWDLAKNLKKAAPGGGGNIPDVHTKVDNNWFAASNSVEFRDKFLAGGNKNHAFASKITGHPFGIYIDLQKAMTSFSAPTMGSVDSSIQGGKNLMMNTWQDIVITGGDFKDGALEFQAEINLVDKSVNSLKQLNAFIDKMSHKMDKRKLREKIMEGVKEPAKDDSDD